MNIRGWSVLAILSLFAIGIAQSRAEEMKSIQPRHQSPGPSNCQVVRDFVAMVGPEQAEKLARDAGASDARIAAARRCMKDVK